MASGATSGSIGRIIGGRYRVVELLGRGGMAEVFKAYQENLDRYVAIKLMHGFLADDKEFLQRFQREARSVANLRHPNIVAVHDFDRDGDDYYMVMEYIDGPTLKSRLSELSAQGKRLPRREAVRIVRDIGSSLSYAHGRGMVHRDIKPANIMLDSGGRVVLTDFGIAKIITGTQLTASGSMIGTPAYMAPEQGLGQPGDHRADIYSLGVVLFQVVTGELPYHADTPLAVILMHVNDPLPDPAAINPDVPLGLQRIIQKSLAKAPNERYQTVDEMLRHLNDFDLASTQQIPHSTLAGSDAATIRAQLDEKVAAPAVASAPTVVAQQAAPVPAAAGRRNRGLIWGIIGGVLLLLLLGVFGALGARGVLFGGEATPTASPTETAAPTETATEIPTATEDVILQLTLDALEATNAALQAEPTETGAPDLTATFDACTFDYEVVAQTPENESNLLVNDSVEGELRLRNTGDCAWDDSYALAYAFGEAESSWIEVGAVEPGDEVKVAMAFNTGTVAGELLGTAQLFTMEMGAAVGERYEMVFDVIVPATFPPTNTPTPEATATPAGPTNTPTGPITGVSATFFRCEYDDTEYVCDVIVNVGGGAPPFTVVVGADTIACNPNVGTSCSLKFRQRRCSSASFAIDVVDSTGATFTGFGGIDPADPTFFIFPPDNKSPCGTP